MRFNAAERKIAVLSLLLQPESDFLACNGGILIIKIGHYSGKEGTRSEINSTYKRKWKNVIKSHHCWRCGSIA